MTLNVVAQFLEITGRSEDECRESYLVQQITSAVSTTQMNALYFSNAWGKLSVNPRAVGYANRTQVKYI